MTKIPSSKLSKPGNQDVYPKSKYTKFYSWSSQAYFQGGTYIPIFYGPITRNGAIKNGAIVLPITTVITL